MKANHHAEFEAYLQDLEMARRCRDAVEAWKSSGETIRAEAYEIEWSYAAALEFVGALQRLFQAYNQVLWGQFPFCRLCLGECCKPGASYVSLFDGLALAFLGQSLPQLGEEIETGPERCVYLTPGGCSWPVEWMDFKCRLFWCLGAPGRRLNSLTAQQATNHMARKLEETLRPLLPEALRHYESISGVVLVRDLEDSLAFTERLGAALDAVFTRPLLRRFPGIWDGRKPMHFLNPDNPENHLSPASESVLEFIAWAAEQFDSDGPDIPVAGKVSAGQFLEDLELLEAIALGQEREQRLQELSTRYASLDGMDPGSLGYQMKEKIELLIGSRS